MKGGPCIGCCSLSTKYFYSSGPNGFLLKMNTPEWLYTTLALSMFLIVPLIPVGVYFILRLGSKYVSLKSLFVSILVMVFACPTSIFLLDITDHKGASDFIHAVKSGFIMPIWTFSIGLLLLPK